jgi:NADH:ubiquinone oxidoreductase subunit 3 (subunit A)
MLLANMLFNCNQNAMAAITEAYECGFYPITIATLRYQFTYWFVILHFILYEQELLIALLLIFGV